MAVAERAAALRGHDIVCVGFNDWRTELWTNQHHLMARLARDNRVLFVESLGLRRPKLAGRDVSRMARRAVTGLRGARVVANPPHGDVNVLSPLVLPLHGVPAARAANARLLPALVRRAARGLKLRDPILWGYVPQAELLLDVLEPKRVVYHCVDDIAAQEGIDEESFAAAERRFAARADVVLASAPALAERMRTLNDHVLYAPNVADTESFAAALEPGPVDAALDALPRPRAVFTGAISAKKLDFELLAGLAEALPHVSIALVGPVGLGDPLTDVAPLERLPNVHLLGGRRYEQLPAVLRGTDVALIPYRQTRLTASIFPMKVYEYLAAGLPVLATPLPSLAGTADVTVAAGAAAAATALTGLLESDTPERRRARSEAASAHSWESRLREIAEALELGS